MVHTPKGAAFTHLANRAQHMKAREATSLGRVGVKAKPEGAKPSGSSAQGFCRSSQKEMKCAGVCAVRWSSATRSSARLSIDDDDVGQPPDEDPVQQPQPTTGLPARRLSSRGESAPLLAATAALFLSVHLSALALPVPTDAKLPIARIASTAALAAANEQTGALPWTSWAAKPADDDARWPLLTAGAPAGLAAGAGAYAALALAPVGLITLAGEPELARSIIPDAAALSPLQALDVLVLAPLSEELVFRAWLLSALTDVDTPEPLAAAASALLFGLWHAGGGGDGIGSLTLLGAWLSTLYSRSGGRLSVCIGAHAGYNALSLAVPLFLVHR